MASSKSKFEQTDWRLVFGQVLAFLALMAFSLAWADPMVARYATLEGMPGDFKKTIGMFEAFGHGAGVVLVLLLIWTLDRANAHRAVVVAFAAWGAGLLAIGIKFFVCRLRPSQLTRELVAVNAHGVASAPPLPESVDELSSTGFFHDAIHSFPSGHTAVAFAMAWTLGQLYPTGRWLFLSFATIVAVQRVYAQAHFVSDTVAGAGIGLLVATLVLHYAGQFGLGGRPKPA